MFIAMFSQQSIAQLVTPPLKQREDCISVRLIQNQAVVHISNVNSYLVWAVVKNCGKSTISIDGTWPIYLQEDWHSIRLIYDIGDSTFEVGSERPHGHGIPDGYSFIAPTHLKSGDSSLFSFRPFFDISRHLRNGRYSFQLVFEADFSLERAEFFSNKVMVVVADD
jgi:hypothetical protein